MWRIAWPDGQLSDLGNLSRVKDAAEVICANGRNSALLHWKRHACEKPLEAATGDLTADACVDWPVDNDGGAA